VAEDFDQMEIAEDLAGDRRGGYTPDLTEIEREALRDFVIRAMAAAARLFTMTQEDGTLTRAVAVLELTRVQRHAAAGEALIKPGRHRQEAGGRDAH
jgi:hypothetical protein